MCCKFILTAFSKSYFSVLKTKRNLWKRKLESTRSNRNIWWTTQDPCFVNYFKTKENRRCLSDLCKTFFSHALIFMHVDTFFLHNTIDDVSQREVSWKRRILWQFTYILKIFSASINSWNGSSYHLFVVYMGTLKFCIAILHSDINGDDIVQKAHCSFVILLTA